MNKCGFCGSHGKLQINRKENTNIMSCYIHAASDGSGIFFENTNGLPAYIDINYCPMCGTKLNTNADYSKIGIEELDLSVRQYCMIKRHGINYISQVLDLTVDDLLKIRNIGEKCANEIYKRIQEFKEENN